MLKDNDGDAFGDRSGELKHYNVEYGPAAVSTNEMCQSLAHDCIEFNKKIMLRLQPRHHHTALKINSELLNLLVVILSSIWSCKICPLHDSLLDFHKLCQLVS